MAEVPEAGERGRYAIFVAPDGSIVIPRATGLCESCATCGCGEQQQELRIPAALAAMARAAADGKIRLPGIGQLRKMAADQGPARSARR